MQQLKEQRLTPACKFVLEIIKGVEPEEPYGCGNVIWWDKYGKYLFEQDFENGYLHINRHPVWCGLEKTYGLERTGIQEVINCSMYKYTNNGRLIPNERFCILNRTYFKIHRRNYSL